jgi:hypothetical protein
VDQLGIITTQEKYDACDVFGLRPLREVCLGHCLPVCNRINDTGRIELTRTPVPLKSAASESIMATAAAFEAAYAAAPAAWSKAAFEATFTIDPWPCFNIAGTTARDNT